MISLIYSARNFARLNMVWRVVLFAALAIAGSMDAALAGSFAKAVTAGGSGGPVYAVTNLADSGPGSLRFGIELAGPKTIVFKVGGEIWLKQSLVIREPFMTIAGETAPNPGISLMGDSLRIRSHDIIVRHLRVRVGALPTGSAPNDRDGIAIDGNDDGTKPAYSILIDHCSVAWAVDENIAIWGENSHDIVIRNSIVAEGLFHSIHPDGEHSEGLLVGPHVRNILIEKNLFISNQWRNPAISPGSTAIIANNFLYNPGGKGLHYYTRRNNDSILAVVMDNLVQAGPNTKSVLLSFKDGLPPGSQFYYKANVALGTTAFDRNEPVAVWGHAQFMRDPPISLPSWFSPIPVRDVRPLVLLGAGARPWNRDATDLRLVFEARHGTGRIPDEPVDSRLKSRKR